MNETQENQPTLHIRFEGKSRDIPLAEIDIGVASTDEQVKEAVANFLDTEVSKLENYVIEHHTNGNFTIRPEAVFGEETNGEGVVEIKFPLDGNIETIKKLMVNGEDLLNHPCKFRRLILTIDHNSLPELVVYRVVPVNPPG